VTNLSTATAPTTNRIARDPNKAPFASDTDRWNAVVRRDRAANGVFYYSVKTTGVYCRPSCSARLARRENVRFHTTGADAEAAGFRPCKRCRPNQPAAMAPAPIRFAMAGCSLGMVLVAAGDTGVSAILLGDDAEALVRDVRDRFPEAAPVRGGAEVERWAAQVATFVEVPRRGLDLPLDVRGTAFQQKVWRALGMIPVGATASYADIAARIGAPQAIRAVAQACGANPLAVAIPCHRVVGKNGALSGYRWGVERKRALLDREAAA
jgi:AraC family transcriptional regulator, regulatory protein of adaptative response / methylated-DNA-[protein]-cysteine methyltransferase